MKLSTLLRGAVSCATVSIFTKILVGPAQAWVPIGPETWPDGIIPFHLNLGGNPIYSDGSTPDQVATRAFAAWNPQMQRVQLRAQTLSVGAVGLSNQRNEVWFDDRVGGSELGNGVLAVTVLAYEGERIAEADVVVNSKHTWDAYSGYLRPGVEDLERVLLHEFGHALGLGHPDEAGQSTEAIMNSRVSLLNTLAADDLDGIGTLYGFTTTNPPRPPVLFFGPTFTRVSEREPFTLTAAGGGSGNLTYQWYRDGIPVPGANQSYLFIPRAALTDAGSYYVTLSSPYGSVSSEPAWVEVLARPALAMTLPRAPRFVVEGDGFSIQGEIPTNYLNNPDLRYQWYLNDRAIAGAEDRSLFVQNATLADAGLYHCVISLGNESAPSNLLRVDVGPYRINPTGSIGVERRTAASGDFVGFGAGFNSGRLPQWVALFKDGRQLQTLPGQEPQTSYRFSTIASLHAAGEYALVAHGPEGASVLQVHHVSVDGEPAPRPPRAIVPLRDLLIASDDVFPDLAGGTWLVDRAQAQLLYWDPRRYGISKRLALRGTPVRIQFLATPSRLFFSYVDGVVTVVPLDQASLAESIIPHGLSSQSPWWNAPQLAIADRLLLINTGGPASVAFESVTNILHATSGHIGPGQWIPAKRRLYQFTRTRAEGTHPAAWLSIDTLGNAEVGPTFLGSNDDRVRASVSPDGAMILGPSGLLIQAEDQYNNQYLDRTMDSAVWTDTHLFTAIETASGIILERRPRSSFKPDLSTVVPLGHNPFLHYDAVGSLQLVYTVDGEPRISRFDHSLNPMGETQPLLARSSSSSRLSNLSTRVQLPSDGDGLVVVGFVVEGSETLPLLIRAVGPGLLPYGITSFLADPSFRVFDSAGRLVATNEDWGGDRVLSQTFGTLGAFGLPDDSKDAALLLELPPGPYTVHVQRRDAAGGVVLLELYDATTAPRDARLSNLSTRMLTGSGERVLTAGFVIAGADPQPVLVRAAGPTLSSFGVENTIPDPVIALRQGQALIARNDDWNGHPTLRAISAGLGAFAFPTETSKDSALATDLAPGAYTVQVTDSDPGAAGVTLIEVYATP